MKTIKLLFKIIVFLIVGILTLMALLIAIENWTGKRAWESSCRDLESQGISLDPASYIPPPVPEAQNFASTPLLARLRFDPANTNFDSANTNGSFSEKVAGLLSDPNYGKNMKSQLRQPDLVGYRLGKTVDVLAWQGFLETTNLLSLLDDVRPELEEISTASRRPFARFPIAYEKGIEALLPHLAMLRSLGRLYLIRAVVNLRQGNTDSAFEDVNTLFRLAESIKNEPFLLSILARYAVLDLYLQGVWEGLVTHQWSPVQRQEIQKQTLEIDLLAEYKKTFRGEQVLFWNKTFINTKPKWRHAIGNGGEALFILSGISVFSKGFLYHNMATLNRFSCVFQSLIDVPAHAVNADDAEQAMESLTIQKSAMRGYNLHVVLAGMFLPALGSVIHRTASLQTFVDQAAVACALDHYWSEKGSYPDSLDLLVPEYIAKLPHDVISRQPMKYRLLEQGGYLLYAVGWNGKDDGGTTAKEKINGSVRLDTRNGDLVWFSAK